MARGPRHSSPPFIEDPSQHSRQRTSRMCRLLDFLVVAFLPNRSQGRFFDSSFLPRTRSTNRGFVFFRIWFISFRAREIERLPLCKERLLIPPAPLRRSLGGYGSQMSRVRLFSPPLSETFKSSSIVPRLRERVSRTFRKSAFLSPLDEKVWKVLAFSH